MNFRDRFRYLVRPLKLLDRYILKQFFLATLVSLAGFIIIYVAVDMMEKLDKFMDKQVPWYIVLEYYINFTPQIIVLILPVALLLGTLFSTGKMSTQNEIIAMRSAGMSLYRLMIPYVLSAFLISGAAVYFNGWVLPRANSRVLEIQRDYVHENLISSAEFDLHMQDSPTTIVVMQDFSLPLMRANRVSIQTFDAKTGTHLVKRIDASAAQWDSVKRAWRLIGAMERTFSSDSGGERFQNLPYDQSLVHFSFTPSELRERQLRIEEMTNTQLAERIALKKRSGQFTSQDEVDYQAKYSLAFTSLIVVLFGVPFASKKKRGGLSFEFSIAILISFLFLTFTKISQTFGYAGEVPPILTAWMGNILFFLASLIVIWKAQK